MSSSAVTRTRRTIVYIDGLNLYYGLVDQGWRKYLWLNLNLFAKSILRDDQLLLQVKYFTTEVLAPADKVSRQRSYLAAIRTLKDVTVEKGRYESDPLLCEACSTQLACPTCRRPWMQNKEKMTDVKIATSIIVDAIDGRFDDAILVTGDADQVPTVVAVTRRFKDKRVFVCLPPRRKSYHLGTVAPVFSATEEQYRTSQFPEVVDTAPGRTVTKPDKWTRNEKGRG